MLPVNTCSSSVIWIIILSASLVDNIDKWRLCTWKSAAVYRVREKRIKIKWKDEDVKTEGPQHKTDCMHIFVLN